jgi:CRP-like cAMP-binding protein
MEFAVCQEGCVVFSEGDPAQYFYIIESGSVEVIIKEKVVKVLNAGEFFGDYSLLYNSPRSATIKAKETTSFWILSRNNFQGALKRIKLAQFKANRKIIENIKLFGKTRCNSRTLESNPKGRLSNGAHNREVPTRQQHCQRRRSCE